MSELASSASRATHDAQTPAALVDFMSRDWLDTPHEQQPHAQIARFAKRRERVSAMYPGAYVVVPSGQEHVRANDTYFRFRSSSDFAYLVGPGEPGSVLILEPDGAKHRALLFAPAHNRGTAAFFTDRTQGELWVGRHRGLDESKAYYGIDACAPLEELGTYLGKLRDAGHRALVLRGSNRAVDAIFAANQSDADFATALSEMRLIKDEYELAELRKACEITKRGFDDAIVAMKTATSEREIEAAFWRRARMEANDVGYLTIAASGHHACTLHWTKNDGRMKADALLLLDAGVECDSLYTADVTRTLPIGGRYSAQQRTIYELVWAAQRAGIEAVAPGADYLAPNRAAMRVLAEGLIEIGILTCSLDEALDPVTQFYRRYTLHNVSHMLGLDVHDCARARAETYQYGTLREGMVLTVEPGLYFQVDDATVPEAFRGIGVRIEDDIAVTADGWENLSGILPSRVDDVQGWVRDLHH